MEQQRSHRSIHTGSIHIFPCPQMNHELLVDVVSVPVYPVPLIHLTIPHTCRIHTTIRARRSTTSCWWMWWRR